MALMFSFYHVLFSLIFNPKHIIVWEQELSRPAKFFASVGFLFFASFICAISTSESYCQDWIEGEVSGIWLEENNPFILIGETFIPEGETLTVQPGVEISFDPGIDFLAHGTLILNGAEDNHISVTTTNPEDGLGFFHLLESGEEFTARWTDFNSIRIGSEGINAHISNCIINTELERTNWGFNLAPEIVEYENCEIGPGMILDGRGGLIHIHDNQLTGVTVSYESITSMTFENNNLIGGSRISVAVGRIFIVENNHVEGEGGIGIQAFRISQNLNVTNNDLRYVIIQECAEIHVDDCSREERSDFRIEDSESISMSGNNFRIAGLNIDRVDEGIFEDNEFNGGGIDFQIPNLEMRNTTIRQTCTIQAENATFENCHFLNNDVGHRFEIANLWMENCEILNRLTWSISRFESIRNCVFGETTRLWEVEGFNPIDCEFGNLDLRNTTDAIFENCIITDYLSFYGCRQIEINTIEIGGNLEVDGSNNLEINDGEINILNFINNPCRGVEFNDCNFRGDFEFEGENLTLNNCHIIRNFDFEGEDLTLNDVTIDGHAEIPIIQRLTINGGSFFRTEISRGGDVNLDGLTVRDYLVYVFKRSWTDFLKTKVYFF